MTFLVDCVYERFGLSMHVKKCQVLLFTFTNLLQYVYMYNDCDQILHARSGRNFILSNQSFPKEHWTKFQRCKTERHTCKWSFISKFYLIKSIHLDPWFRTQISLEYKIEIFARIYQYSSLCVDSAMRSGFFSFNPGKKLKHFLVNIGPIKTLHGWFFYL
jgi:hypothetical protein